MPQHTVKERTKKAFSKRNTLIEDILARMVVGKKVGPNNLIEALTGDAKRKFLKDRRRRAKDAKEKGLI